MGKSGNMEISGVAVNAARPENRQRIVTWSDVDGSYWLQVPDDGEYFVRTQMAAFAPAFARVAIDANNRAAKADLEMVLLSRAPNTREQFALQMAAQGGRGFQSLSVTQGEGGADPPSGAADDQATPAGMPSLGASASTATESVAVSGATEGSTLAGMSSEELQQRFQEARDRQGGFGGGGAFSRGGGGEGGGV